MDQVKQFFLSLGFLVYVKPAIVTFMVTMGAVYGLGRMLNVVKTRIGKNRVAMLAIVVVGPLEALAKVPQKVNDCAMLVGLGILLYTLIGMKLFSRLDRVQDVKIGEDDPNQDEGTIVAKPTKPAKPAKSPRRRK